MLVEESHTRNKNPTALHPNVMGLQSRCHVQICNNTASQIWTCL